MPGRAAAWRRRAPALAALTSLLLAGSVLAAGDAGADTDKTGVRPVTSVTAPLVPGQSAWLAVVWTADQTVDHWSTTVTAPAGVGVSYPTTRGGSDTSLYGSATLVGDTVDFTAFKLAVPYTQQSSFPVTLTSTYTSTCGDNGQCKDNGAGNDGKARSYTRTSTVTVPVLPDVGPAYVQRTTSLAITARTSTFQQISFTGGLADLAGFRVRLGALPAGLVVGYPGDGSSSGLAGSASLEGLHTDYVGVRFDASHLAPGTYAIPLTISYTAAAPHTATGTVTLVVS